MQAVAASLNFLLFGIENKTTKHMPALHVGNFRIMNDASSTQLLLKLYHNFHRVYQNSTILANFLFLVNFSVSAVPAAFGTNEIHSQTLTNIQVSHRVVWFN